MTPAPRPPRKRNETRELVEPIMAALNALPGVRVWRPHVLNKSIRGLSGAGLADGSADLVGVCRVQLPVVLSSMPPQHPSIGRFLALEVKQANGGRVSDDQWAWLRTVRDLGGFAAVVHSVEEATAAVERCRRGECA